MLQKKLEMGPNLQLSRGNPENKELTDVPVRAHAV